MTARFLNQLDQYPVILTSFWNILQPYVVFELYWNLIPETETKEVPDFKLTILA